jgi:LysR family glycine cleavage system transcriptional activator
MIGGMAYKVPYLALKAFVEVVKRGNMSGAAAALGVTVGAVSQQMKLLEQRLGTILLHRSGGGIRPAPDGEKLYASLVGAFEQIDDAVDGAKSGAEKPRHLNITTTASFAAGWLVPRLDQFRQSHPNVEISIESSTRLVDLRAEKTDVAIRYGQGSYSGLDSFLLLQPALVPICRPGLFAGSVTDPADCLNARLLQEPARANWLRWFRSQGIHDERAALGPVFSDDLLLIKAAAAGQGIALVHDIYLEPELSTGAIVVPIDRRCAAPYAYHFVASAEAIRRPEVAAFMTWLVGEASARTE